MIRSVGGPLAAGVRWSLSVSVEDEALSDQAMEFVVRIEAQAAAFGKIAQEVQRLRGTHLAGSEAGGCAGCPD